MTQRDLEIEQLIHKIKKQEEIIERQKDLLAAAIDLLYDFEVVFGSNAFKIKNSIMHLEDEKSKIDY